MNVCDTGIERRPFTQPRCTLEGMNPISVPSKQSYLLFVVLASTLHRPVSPFFNNWTTQGCDEMRTEDEQSGRNAKIINRTQHEDAGRLELDGSLYTWYPQRKL